MAHRASPATARSLIVNNQNLLLKYYNFLIPLSFTANFLYESGKNLLYLISIIVSMIPQFYRLAFSLDLDLVEVGLDG
jgi:hypothetical protein